MCCIKNGVILIFNATKRLSLFYWEFLRDNDINVYADNMNTAINSIANECIPYRHIRVKASDPPWLTSFLERYIRKRKRAYRKAKRTNMESH